jgi:hypothetical protein
VSVGRDRVVIRNRGRIRVVLSHENEGESKEWCNGGVINDVVGIAFRV